MSTILQTLFAYNRSPIGATDVTIALKYLKDIRGNYITAMPANTPILYGTIEPRSSTFQESISFTGIQNDGNNQVTLLGVTRNLNPQPPYTAGTPNVPHGNNIEIILSNSAGFYSDFLQKTVDAIITASFQFPTPTLPANPATKDFVENLTVNKADKDLDNTFTGENTFLGEVNVLDATTSSNPVTLAQLMSASLIGIQAGFEDVDVSYGDDDRVLSIHDNINGRTYVFEYDANGYIVAWYDGYKRTVVSTVNGRIINNITN